MKQPFQCRRTVKTGDFAPDSIFFDVNIAYIVQSEPVPKSVKQGDLSGPYLVACAMYSEKLPGLRKNID